MEDSCDRDRIMCKLCKVLHRKDLFDIECQIVQSLRRQ